MKYISGNAVRSDKILLILLALLFLIRLAMVAGYPVFVKLMPTWTWLNNDGYDTIAINWVTTGTFALEKGVPTATRLPLYPCMIAACYMAAGKAFPLIVMLIQAIFSTATGYMLFRMTEDLFGRQSAIITLSLFIMHPQVNNFIFRCATETLFIFIIMAFLRGIVRYLQAKERKDLIWSAVWLGLSLLLRQTLAPLIVLCLILFLLWSVVRHRITRIAFRRFSIALAIVALILAPWISRNYARTGRVPVLQTWVGQPLFQGTYVSQHLADFLRREKTLTDLDQEALSIIRNKTSTHLSGCPPKSRPIEREIIADRYARRLAYARLMENPWSSFCRVLRNLIFAPVLQMTWKSTFVLMLWNWPLLLLSLTGSVWCFRRQRTAFLRAMPITIIFCYLLILHAMVWPQARYILPGLVPFSAFAGFGLVQIFRRSDKKKEL